MIAQSAKNLWRSAKKKLGRTPPGKTVYPEAVTLRAIASDQAKATVIPSPGAPVERRLAYLEDSVQELMSDMATLKKDLQTERRERDEDVRTARQEQAGAAKKLRESIAQLATGGLRLEAVGVVWLALGVALTTWPEVVAGIVPT